MFKFFRQYNKLILVVGAAFLMVAFLIQPVLSMFMGSPGDQSIGTIGDEELTLADQRTAAAELELLNQLNPVLGISAMTVAEQDAEKWLLMTYDARRLGLSASDSMINQMFQTLELDQVQINQAARQFGVSDDLAQQAMRHWIMIQQYQSLMLGEEHVSPFDKLMRLRQILDLQQRAQQALASNDFQTFMQVQQQMQSQRPPSGSVRLSEPLVQWYVSEQQATVSGEALLVSAEQYLDNVDAPSESDLQSLFDAHRDELPGESEPFGFGYKYPDRVKLEWLAFPLDTLRDQVEVEYIEAYEYYQQHPHEFHETSDTSETPQSDTESDDHPEHQPFNAVRHEIEDRLRDEKAEQLAQQMVTAAQAELFSQFRRLDLRGGYRQIPDDFEPSSLEAVADRLEEQFDVRPRIERRAEQWVPATQWSELEDLGQSYVQGRPQARFADYVRSARQLEPAETGPLAGLRLQMQMPSQPMVGADGSRYLFRLTDVQPSHAPESLEEVREQVVEDARRRAAYEALVEQQEQWEQRAVEEGFEALVEEQTHVSIQAIDSIPRRRFGMGGELTVPSVPGIGSQADLVDGLFETAERVSDRGREPVTEAPEADRTGAVAVPSELSVAVYRVDEYQPLTRSQFDERAQQQEIEAAISGLLLDETDEAALSKEAIAERVGFKRVERTAPNDQSQPQQPQRRPGSI